MGKEKEYICLEIIWIFLIDNYEVISAFVVRYMLCLTLFIIIRLIIDVNEITDHNYRLCRFACKDLPHNETKAIR